jgi:hypothetical protein
MSEAADERPMQPPPGWFAWGTTLATLAAPVMGGVFGWYGVANNGNDIIVVPFAVGFGLLTIATIMSIVVHLWGMVRAFYPRISKPWMAICLLGIVAGCEVLVAGVVIFLRMYGQL